LSANFEASEGHLRLRRPAKSRDPGSMMPSGRPTARRQRFLRWRKNERPHGDRRLPSVEVELVQGPERTLSRSLKLLRATLLSPCDGLFPVRESLRNQHIAGSPRCTQPGTHGKPIAPEIPEGVAVSIFSAVGPSTDTRLQTAGLGLSSSDATSALQ
jgi:hypothetical protein